MPGVAKPGVDWTAIEANYRAGESMGSLARRLANVTRQAIGKRCRKEGWQRGEDADALAATDTMRRIAQPVTGPDKRIAAEGRRSPATMQRIVDMLASGATVAMAARRVGMSPDTVHDWFRGDPAFKLAADAAQAAFGSGLVERIADAGKRGVWQADAHLLERHPATRGDFAPRMEVGAGTGLRVSIAINAPGFTGGAYRDALATRTVPAIVVPDADEPDVEGGQ